MVVAKESPVFSEKAVVFKPSEITCLIAPPNMMDQQPVLLFVPQEKLDQGMEKFGSSPEEYVCILQFRDSQYGSRQLIKRFERHTLNIGEGESRHSAYRLETLISGKANVLESLSVIDESELEKFVRENVTEVAIQALRRGTSIEAINSLVESFGKSSRSRTS